MEKAIDIKRRAQRCIQNNDLDGALKEYEKLIALQDSDPYNFVLLADLLYKKGDTVGAAQRYIMAIESYERATLFKNAIAVGKKMMRLSLSPTLVLQKLAGLHALDGLGTEAALFYQQYAEHLLRDNRTTEAADALRKAFEASPENVKALERLADVFILDGDNESAARTLAEATVHYQTAGLLQDADRCRVRASTVGGGTLVNLVPPDVAAPVAAAPVAMAAVPPPNRSAMPGAMNAVETSPRSEVFEVERSHMTSLSGSSTDEDSTFEIERTPVADAKARHESSLAGAINHSLEVTPAPENDSPTGPPALDLSALAKAETERAPNRIHGGPPALPVAAHQPAPNGGVEDEFEVATPGLRFGGPAAAHGTGGGEGGDTEAPASAPQIPPAENDSVIVERLLREAREQFRKGERELAASTLVHAAQLYDEMGQFDSAASIYRNLGRSTHAVGEVMTLWLRNCEARNDRLEAAQVACELGDRALNDGDLNVARGWFRRATALDAANETAKRRLQKWASSRPPAAPSWPRRPRAAAPMARWKSRSVAARRSPSTSSH